MKTLTGQLKAERKLLSDPKRWTKGHFARDANGIPTDYYSKTATCWCQMGAAQKIGSNVSATSLKQLVSGMFNYQDDVAFNDAPKTTHKDLMEFYDVCIIHAKNIDSLVTY